MPRLVPRLVKALTSADRDFLARPGPRHVASPPTPPLEVSRKLEQHERPPPLDLSTKRTKSILLDPANPILHPQEYKPLKYGVKKRSWDALHVPATFDNDISRLVHDENIKQRANPYCK